MKPIDLLRILRRRATKAAVEHVEWPGKGGHIFIRHGGRTTVVPMHRSDLKIGTYRAILRDLGLTPSDVED